MFYVAVIGLGYFSQFHLDAWEANPGTRIVAVVDHDQDVANAAGNEHRCPAYASTAEMLDEQDPAIVDIVAPPPAHASIIEATLAPGRVIVCQKPFCTSLDEAERMAKAAQDAGAHLIVHENFRFQPWYRALKAFLDDGGMGTVYQARFDLRAGDGRGPEAYLDRQPGFQKMERFLVQETAVHLIDTFRFLFGDVTSVYADLRRINSHILGEDAGILIMEHEKGPRSVFDGNRLSDHVAKNARLTMGELYIEGEAGSVILNGDGILTFRPFGSRERQVIDVPPFDRSSFGGGCVSKLIDHVVDGMQSGADLENRAEDYLAVLRIVEAAYKSNETGQRVRI